MEDASIHKEALILGTSAIIPLLMAAILEEGGRLATFRDSSAGPNPSSVFLKFDVRFWQKSARYGRFEVRSLAEPCIYVLTLYLCSKIGVFGDGRKFKVRSASSYCSKFEVRSSKFGVFGFVPPLHFAICIW